MQECAKVRVAVRLAQWITRLNELKAAVRRELFPAGQILTASERLTRRRGGSGRFKLGFVGAQALQARAALPVPPAPRAARNWLATPARAVRPARPDRKAGSVRRVPRVRRPRAPPS